MIEGTIAFLLLALIVSGMIWCRHGEIQRWNGGKHTCGQPWEHFDNSSQGCRGYVCRRCQYYTWITYAVDKPSALAEDVT